MKVLLTVLGAPLLFLIMLIYAIVSIPGLLSMVVPSLFIYTFGSKEQKVRRRAQMKKEWHQMFDLT